MRAWTRPTTSTLLLAAAAVVVAVSSPSPAGAERGRSHDAGIEAVQALTARYSDPRAAVADGFAATQQCVPAMGYHYVNFSRLDGPLEPSRPEVLLYADGPDGHVLIGAEWIVVDRDQDLATDDDRPSLFGHPFDGPMPGHGPGMPIHYDLHAYAGSTTPTAHSLPGTRTSTATVDGATNVANREIETCPWLAMHYFQSPGALPAI